MVVLQLLFLTTNSLRQNHYEKIYTYKPTRIKSNHKNNKREPVITVKTYKSNTYGHQVHILGECKVVYSPDKPLSCGAKVWIETEAEVIVIPDFADVKEG